MLKRTGRRSRFVGVVSVVVVMVAAALLGSGTGLPEVPAATAAATECTAADPAPQVLDVTADDLVMVMEERSQDISVLPDPRTEAGDLPFLGRQHSNGDPLGYGESFWLQNENGDFLTSSYLDLKWGGGASRLPANLLGVLSDVGVAAYFPQYASGDTVAISLISHLPDPSPQVQNDDDTLRIVSGEPQLGSRNILGAWPDSSDCYYFEDYIDGEYAAMQAWVVQKADTSSGPGVCYGDSGYLVNASPKYAGQKLVRDYLAAYNWITTSDFFSQTWTIVPAPVSSPAPAGHPTTSSLPRSTTTTVTPTAGTNR